jgi:hypothetical protein
MKLHDLFEALKKPSKAVNAALETWNDEVFRLANMTKSEIETELGQKFEGGASFRKKDKEYGKCIDKHMATNFPKEKAILDKFFAGYKS